MLGEARQTRLEIMNKETQQVLSYFGSSLGSPLNPAVEDELVAPFVDLSTSEEAMDLFGEMSAITGFVSTRDTEYEVVREIRKSLSLDFGQILAGIPY